MGRKAHNRGKFVPISVRVKTREVVRTLAKEAFLKDNPSYDSSVSDDYIIWRMTWYYIADGDIEKAAELRKENE